VVQNHLLQVTALLAMDAPVGRHIDSVRAEKLRLFRAMRQYLARGPAPLKPGRARYPLREKLYDRGRLR
jgi:hypothetical protein